MLDSDLPGPLRCFVCLKVAPVYVNVYLQVAGA